MYYNLLRAHKHMSVLENIFCSVTLRIFLNKGLKMMSFQRHTVLMSCTLFSFGGIFQVFYKDLSFFFFLIIDQSSQVSFRPTHGKEHQLSFLIWRRIKVELAFNSLNFPASNAKWELMTASGSKEPHKLLLFPHLKNIPRNTHIPMAHC